MVRRILFMISSMRGGGSERQTLLLLQHLDRSLFEPHLYLMERSGDLLQDIPDDVTVHTFADLHQKPWIYIPGRVMRQQIRHLHNLLVAESIDVVYDRTFHMTMIAGPACRNAGKPRVSTIVSPPDRAVPLVERRFVRAKRRRLAKSYKESSHVLAVSKVAADSAESYYALPSGLVNVVPNPVDIAALQKIRLRRSNGSGSHRTIVCVGRMTEEKGQHDLISAVAFAQSSWTEIPPLHIVMVGDGPLRKELEEASRQIQSPHVIEFVGSLPEATSMMVDADALVLPSHFEGMPNVVLEAMVLGIPVIATRAGGTVELERDEPTITWADPKNPQSLAAALKVFAANPESRQQRVEAARRMVEERHDIRKTARIIEQYLKDACGDA